MVKRRTEVVAASLLTAWTDSDTAMQVVGASLGVFGAGVLEPTEVLSTETRLRNALFDVLLSLVEGGALELRTTDDSRYAFRWRDDLAATGLSRDDATPIDLAVPSPYLAVPSPYLAELQRAQAERDDALGRADFAEALVGERERMLRKEATPADAPAPEPAPRKSVTKKLTAKKAPRKAVRAKAAAAKKTDEPEPTQAEGNEVLYLTPPSAEPPPDVDVVEAPDVDLVEAAPPPIDDAGSTVDTDNADGADDAEKQTPRLKWSGYAIDRSRKHLASVERLVDEG